jgi:hypothetical protein
VNGEMVVRGRRVVSYHFCETFWQIRGATQPHFLRLVAYFLYYSISSE